MEKMFKKGYSSSEKNLGHPFLVLSIMAHLR